MSHSNRSLPPRFKCIVQDPLQQFAFEPRVQQANSDIPQQWVLSKPRSVQHNVPSPSTSVRSVVTAPVHRPSDRSKFHPGNVVSIDNRNDSGLLGMDMLAPTGHVARNGYNPLDRHYHEESWNPYHLRNSSTSNDQTSFNQNNASFRSVRTGPGSTGSIAPISDSGFYSQSVVSHDTGRVDQSAVSCNLTQQIGNMKVRSITSEAPRVIRVHSDQQSQISQVSSQSGIEDNQLRCRECKKVSKCRSDYKKHKLLHEKPFKCSVANCKRSDQGFTTINDLDRHRKSVHRINLFSKSYQCASKNCRTKEKIWPRLDNFKQHIDRTHKGEDPYDLIKRSIFVPKHPQIEAQSLSVAPIDTMLVGMEKSFSGHSNYGPIGDSHLRTEQEITQWPAGLNPSTSPLDFHQASDLLPIDRSVTTGPHASQNAFNLESQQQKGSSQPNLFSGSTKSAKNAEQERPGGEQGRDHRPEISNAPQTKFQQQRKVSKQSSQAVSNELDDLSSSIDLEQLVFRVLEKVKEDGEEGDDQTNDVQYLASKRTQADRSSKVVLTKRGVLKASQMISSFIRQSSGSAFSQPRKTGLGFNTHTKVCEQCGYAVARDCDMKKHMKRHDKPYGCTYPKCHKRFGAKSDWKRHENSQHFQLEAYRCSQLSPSGKVCGEHFIRIDHFNKHLDAQHKLSDEQQQAAEVKRRRIGKNCQQQFWCGFHGDIIELKEKRNAAWDERFDHIAKHFEKDKKSIEEWICAEENKTKRELFKEMDRYVFDDEDERGENGSGLGSNGPPLSVPMNVPLPPPPPPLPLYDQTTSLQQTPVHNQSDTRKRTASADLEETQVQGKGTKSIVSTKSCCLCLRVFGSCDKACLGCGHAMCNYCPQQETRGAFAEHRKRRKTVLVINKYCCQCNDPCGELNDACINCEHKMCTRCRTECSEITY